jgi:surfactin synthase thioesterase subunit
LLFLLAHATGAAGRYAELLGGLSAKARLAPLDLPGHGSRRGERALSDMEGIREDLAVQAAAALRGDGSPEGPGAAPQARAARPPEAPEGSAFPGYFVFGHSMGAVCGYVMTERLMALGYGPPRRFFASSFSVPGWHPIPPGMADLPDLQMWQESALRFGVLNGQPVPDPERMETHSPVYRADLRAVEGYRPGRLTVLPCPVTVFYAESDMVDGELAGRWRGLSARPPEIVRVPGGHFHPLERPGQLEGLLLARL